MNDQQVHTLFGGVAYAWVEQSSSIMLKVVTKAGDPAELQAEDARELAALLVQLADELDQSDGVNQ